MTRFTAAIVTVSFCLPSSMLMLGGCDLGTASIKDVESLRIEITRTKVIDHNLEIEYQIVNDSQDDVWILAGWDGLGANCEIFMADDDRTLMIRRLHSLPLEFGLNPPPFQARYARLRPGERRTGAVFRSVPVRPFSYFERTRRTERGLERATRVVVEFGYYSGDLPGELVRVLRPHGISLPGDLDVSPISQDGFRTLSQLVLSSEQEALVPQGFSKFKGEQVLRAMVDDVRLPYEEKKSILAKFEVPDLTSCRAVEVHYQPSMLEFFFPRASEQSLLTAQETDYLQSNAHFRLEDSLETVALAADLARAGPPAISLPTTTHADLLCHFDSKPPISLRVYGDGSIKISEVPLACRFLISRLRVLTPLVQDIHLRTECAGNMKNQWCRMRLFNHHEAMRQNDPSIRNQILYPQPPQWCDDMLRPWPTDDGFGRQRWDRRTHTCPGASGGKCHYAMNPSCKPDSLPDMVLLFETKGGWNKHGGPELFTFDNHDPKGGCVLLNDGTVKFVRTAEELRQLRWK